MKRILRFSRFFLPAMVLFLIIVVAGISGYAIRGLNLGVDFQAGFIQEVQFAPGRVGIQDIRAALASLGETVSVQNLGDPQDGHFMIRIRFEEGEDEKISADRIMNALDSYFGKGSVELLRSDLVDQRFSRNLTDQAGRLLGLTLLIILLYASIRFKPRYAIGAVFALVHDALVMAAFITWSRMEFNTTTIAAILTILGYSINNTIVIFDRIRETRRIYPDISLVDIFDRSLSEVLSRTIITTFTTMLAVLALYIFATGSIKDFALALLVGLVAGAYSSMIVASGFVSLWDRWFGKRSRKAAAVPVKAVKAVKA
jgi:preprotein translocase subunit SecF